MDLQPFFAVRHLYHWVSTPFMSIITKIKRGSFQPTKALFLTSCLEYQRTYQFVNHFIQNTKSYENEKSILKIFKHLKNMILICSRPSRKTWRKVILGQRAEVFVSPFSCPHKETKVCKRCFLSFCRPKDVEGSSSCSTPRARLREPLCLGAFVQSMNKKRTEQWGWPAFSSCIQKFALA